MKKIVFVCHGNICRSPMAEFVFQELARRRGVQAQFAVSSAATTTDVLGEDMHPGAKRKLREQGIPFSPRAAVLLRRADYAAADLFIGMDHWNRQEMLAIFGGDAQGKVHLLLDFTPAPRDIDDPWYTGDFDASWRDICAGCSALLESLC